VRRRRALEQGAARLQRARRRPAHAQRHAPETLRAGARAERQVAALREVHARGLAGLAHERRLEQRDARSQREVVDHRADVAPALRGERGDQIGGGRVAARVLLQVAADAALEHLGPEPAVERHDHARALAVGDRVKRVRDVVARLDRLADLARAGQTVGLERVELGHQLGGARLQLGESVHDDHRLHPARKALVEPQIVPPRHGHQVAEPLVRELVRHHERKAAALRDRRALIEQHQRVSEGDQAGVLHRAVEEVGYGHDVELVERVRRVEPALERGDDARRALQRVGQLRAAAARCQCAEGQRGTAHGARRDRALDHVERPHRPGHQVGGDGLRGGEAVRRVTAGLRAHPDLE
jgi:hypothetical protein